MNTALLVLRVIPAVLLLGHGLQKLVPARLSPPLLHANGLWATGAGFEQIGIRPGVAAALVAGLSEVIGGFSLFEFPLLLLALGFVISALGAGSYSIDHWAGVANWAGIDWSMSLVGRAAIALAIGVGAGVTTVLVGYVARSGAARPGVPATS
jgi:putative oxidoreductase